MGIEPRQTLRYIAGIEPSKTGISPPIHYKVVDSAAIQPFQELSACQPGSSLCQEVDGFKR